MGQWKKIWGCLPIDWGTEVGKAENLTQKVWMRNNLDGSAVRIKFSNRYGKGPLVLENVTVGTCGRGGHAAKKLRIVTSCGKKTIVIQPGESFYSDRIPLEVKQSEDLTVAVYFGSAYRLYSVCQTWSAKSWASVFQWGDQTHTMEWAGMETAEALPFFQRDEYGCSCAAAVCGAEVLTEASVTTVACFGDSITHMSYYFDPLLETLYQSFPGKVTILNCGIGGNRILYDACFAKDVPGNGKCFGDAGIKRFWRDVYEDATPELVFFLEGVNDCTHGLAFGFPKEVPTPGLLFEGIRKIVDRAHMCGSRIFVGTVMPFGCQEEPFREQAEGIRQGLNGLLRSELDTADGLIDLDEIMRKPEDIHFLQDGCHLGDWIHPNKCGGDRMAEAISEYLLPALREQAEGEGSREENRGE